MAIKKGQYAKIIAQVGVTPVPVAQLREWSISVSSEKVDSTSAGDGWKKHEIGLLGWEGEATFVDADQYWLENIGLKLDIEFYDVDADVVPIYKGKASLDFDRTVPYDELIETTITFTGDGELELGV